MVLITQRWSMSHSQLDLLSEIAPVRYSRRRKHGTTRYWETIDRKLPFDAPGCRVELLLALVKGHGWLCGYRVQYGGTRRILRPGQEGERHWRYFHCHETAIRDAARSAACYLARLPVPPRNCIERLRWLALGGSMSELPKK